MAKEHPLRPLRGPPSASSTHAGEMLKSTLLQEYVPGEEVEPTRRGSRPSNQRHRRLKGCARLSYSHPLLPQSGPWSVVPDRSLK